MQARGSAMPPLPLPRGLVAAVWRKAGLGGCSLARLSSQASAARQQAAARGGPGGTSAAICAAYI